MALQASTAANEGARTLTQLVALNLLLPQLHAAFAQTATDSTCCSVSCVVTNTRLHLEMKLFASYSLVSCVCVLLLLLLLILTVVSFAEYQTIKGSIEDDVDLLNTYREIAF